MFETIIFSNRENRQICIRDRLILFLGGSRGVGGWGLGQNDYNITGVHFSFDVLSS